MLCEEYVINLGRFRFFSCLFLTTFISTESHSCDVVKNPGNSFTGLSFVPLNDSAPFTYSGFYEKEQTCPFLPHVHIAPHENGGFGKHFENGAFRKRSIFSVNARNASHSLSWTSNSRTLF